jgi:hypothetical protein
LKKTEKIFTVVLLLAGLAANVFPQAFSDKGYHPRITALGRSVVALKEDVGLQFYNPASIGFGNSIQVFAGFTNLYPNVSDDNLNVMNAGASYPFENIGTVGVGLSQFSPNFWTERTILLSFASHMLLKNLSIGASAKILSWSADAPKGENAVPEPATSFTGISFDAGVLYVIPELFGENDLQVGMSLSDITQPSVAANGSADAALPFQFSAGAAYISHKYQYTVMGGMAIRGTDTKINFGYEISAMKTSTFGVDAEFIVRIGGGRIISTLSQGEYNGGFGIVVEKVKVDYSYSYQAFIQNVGGISSIALSYEF